jgi:hypothetical protein
MPIDHEQFLKQLAERFPEVIGEISDYSHGLLHCEMADFRRVVETAMDQGALWRVELYLRFLNDCRETADPDLANAIDVSFLEDFAFGEITEARLQAVRERMPARLRKQVVALNNRWR